MQHCLPKEHTQPHRSPQKIPATVTCMRQRWKMRCQISYHQPTSTPNFCLLSHSKTLRTLHKCCMYSLQNLNLKNKRGIVCMSKKTCMLMCLWSVYVICAWPALSQPFIFCAKLVCQQRVDDLEHIQSSPQAENVSTSKGSATLLTRAAQRSFAYIRIRAAQLSVNMFRETIDTLQTLAWDRRNEDSFGTAE